MSRFSEKWITETRDLAIKCVNSRFIELINKGENGTITDEEGKEVKVLSDTIKDAYGMWYISEMIWRVNHELGGRFAVKAELSAHEVYDVISKESYWTNVFNNKLDTEEAININNLKNSLAELVKL